MLENREAPNPYGIANPTRDPYKPKDYKAGQYPWYTRVDPKWAKNAPPEALSTSPTGSLSPGDTSLSPPNSPRTRAEVSSEAHVRRLSEKRSQSRSPKLGPL